MAGRKPRLSTPSGPGLGGKPNELSDVLATVGAMPPLRRISGESWYVLSAKWVG